MHRCTYTPKDPPEFSTGDVQLLGLTFAYCVLRISESLANNMKTAAEMNPLWHWYF